MDAYVAGKTAFIEQVLKHAEQEITELDPA